MTVGGGFLGCSATTRAVVLVFLGTRGVTHGPQFNGKREVILVIKLKDCIAAKFRQSNQFLGRYRFQWQQNRCY